jgi:hypothetical protein
MPAAPGSAPVILGRTQEDWVTRPSISVARRLSWGDGAVVLGREAVVLGGEAVVLGGEAVVLGDKAVVQRREPEGGRPQLVFAAEPTPLACGSGRYRDTRPAMTRTAAADKSVFER